MRPVRTCVFLGVCCVGAQTRMIIEQTIGYCSAFTRCVFFMSIFSLSLSLLVYLQCKVDEKDDPQNHVGSAVDETSEDVSEFVSRTSIVCAHVNRSLNNTLLFKNVFTRPTLYPRAFREQHLPPSFSRACKLFNTCAVVKMLYVFGAFVMCVSCTGYTL